MTRMKGMCSSSDRCISTKMYGLLTHGISRSQHFPIPKRRVGTSWTTEKADECSSEGSCSYTLRVNPNEHPHPHIDKEPQPHQHTILSPYIVADRIPSIRGVSDVRPTTSVWYCSSAQAYRRADSVRWLEVARVSRVLDLHVCSSTQSEGPVRLCDNTAGSAMTN